MFSSRAALLQKRLHSLFSLQAGGFYFGSISRVEATQTKEVALYYRRALLSNNLQRVSFFMQ